ncbi:MAG: DUF481 domain-containing protein [Candidatus Omnitrophota bacterium]|nr:MAG: DUF481 domain-containing protein [Candidatus Omnitrophota bacterium]
MYAKSKHQPFTPYLLLMVFCILANNSFADEVYLKNKDKISGEIIEESEDDVSVKTEAMGVILIKKEFVDRIIKTDRIAKKDESKKEPEKPQIIWQREISAGYNMSRGNTRNEQFSLNALINRNRKHIDEWTFKGNMFYSEADKKIDAQKWHGIGRYAFSFWTRKAWYNFYRLEVDHDRFADVYYRIIPASGVGYWFFDLPETKLLAEGGLGLEYTNYYGDEKSASNLVAAPRLFYEQQLFERIKFTQDIYVYPKLTDSGAYRVHSESAFTLSINDSLGLRLSLIDDYNSKPHSDTKKNDLTLMSSLVCSFGN